MKFSFEIPIWGYKALLVFAALIWGFSFVVMKDVVAVMPPAWLLGVRFLLAGTILGIVLHKRVRAHVSVPVLKAGAVLGLLDFLGFWTQTIGLQHTTPGINAFLTATYCVIVPFAWWVVARKRPSLFNVGAAVLAVAGIWFVSGNGTGASISLGFGEGMTLLCAVAFAVHMVFVSKFALKYDVLVLTVIQFLVEGGLGCVVGAGFETFPPLEAVTPAIAGQIVFLAIFASVIAFGIQNVGLARVAPAQAALFLSLESVFGVVFSVLLYGEALTAMLLLGFALIFSGILVNEVVAPKAQAKRAIVSASRNKWKGENSHE